MVPSSPSRNHDAIAEKTTTETGNIHDIIHQKTRLVIMTTFAAHPSGILFTELKKQIKLTDGNLSRHLKVLEEAELIQSEKQNSGRNSKSTYKLTSSGFQHFVQYIETVDSVLKQAQEAAQRNASSFSEARLPILRTD